MRLSRLMIRTLKEVGAEAELPSHQLTLRAGLARRVSAGIYSLTPLAYRAVRRIEAIIREEMERIGGQEVLLPVVQPAELWQESGRYAAIDASLMRFADRTGHPMVLAMTHEEAVTDLVRAMVDSYRQLPLMLFQLQTKFRDEARPRAGLIRLREFLMKDAYSFHATQADLDAYYEQVVAAYRRAFERMGLPVLVVESSTGLMGGKAAHEFMLLADGGEDTLIVCPGCGYAANQEIATAAKGAPTGPPAPEPLRELHTPGATSIADLSAFLGITAAQTLKAVFYGAGDELILALIRGDLDVNEVKLSNLLGREVRTLSAEESAARGLTVGYTGPVGLAVTGPVRIVADDSATQAPNLVAGANKPGYHLGGVNFGRDYTAHLVGDIAVAAPGSPCPHCGQPLAARRGIEVGNTFKLGTRYSSAFQATFQDETGENRPLVMGCYGIGITRALAGIIEANRDADGIIWPAAVAPYPIHLLVAGKDEAAVTAAEQLYSALGEDRVLFDDRDLSAGIKFKDADLLGMPLRFTVSGRSLASGGAELRVRATGERRIVPLDSVAEVAESLLGTP